MPPLPYHARALAGLTSPSATAIYRLVAYVVAAALWVFEVILDRHQADVEAALARAKPGTAKWYADQVKRFQQGDTLLVDDDGIHYPAGAAGYRLVTQATAKENSTTGQLFIKVATTDATAPGGLRSLDGARANAGVRLPERNPLPRHPALCW